MSFFDLIKNKNKSFKLTYPSTNNGCKNILLVDKSSVKDYNVFVNSVNNNTFPIVYSSTSLHLGVKTDLLSVLQTHFTEIDRIGIVFASSGSNFFLDGSSFFENANIEFIKSIIREFKVKNVDYLACNTLENTEWVNYYDNLQTDTSVILGASNDKTGNIKYGGDWIMESTSQDIENVYFSSNIDYYKYVLDNLEWATGFGLPTSIIVDSNYMYVTDLSWGTINRITLLNDIATDICYNYISGLNGPFGLAMYNNNLYVSNLGNSSGIYTGTTISKFTISNGTVIDYSYNWVSDLVSPSGLVTDNSYVYVANLGIDIESYGTTISRIRMSDTTDICSNWISDLSGPIGLVINNDYTNMYVSNSVDGNISKITMNNGNVTNIERNWTILDAPPLDLTINGEYLYVANPIGNEGNPIGSITQISLANGSIVNKNYYTSENGPLDLLVHNDYMYVSNSSGTISQYDFPVVISNICFIENTTILTDQGYIPIYKIRPNINTIRGKKIVDVTRTTTIDDYLVCFDKDSIVEGYPSEKTTMSKNHKVFYEGKMKEAHTFLDTFENVNKVKYNGEILYNILMEEHTSIRANNLICETLDPKNLIAKISKYSKEEKRMIKNLLNDAAQKKDYVKRCKRITKNIK